MRNLTQKEINFLTSQGCSAENWNHIQVTDGFTPEHIYHTEFSGNISLGKFDKVFTLPGGVTRHSGLRHVKLHNVTVGDNTLIENVQNYIANYEIGDRKSVV